MLDIKSLFQAMVPNRNSPLYESYPMLKLIGVLTILVTLILCPIEIAILLALIVLAESIVGKTIANVFQFLRSLRYIFLPIGVLVFLLNPPDRAILITTRLIVGSVAFLNVYATTRILSIEQALERLKLPESATRTISLAIRLIPLAIKDAEQSIEALTLRGIYKGSFRGVTQILSIILATSLDRAEFLAEALSAKYFLMRKRKYPWRFKIGAVDMTFFFAKILCLLWTLYGLF